MNGRTTASVRSISPSISFTSENMNLVRYATNTEKTMTKMSKSNIVQEGRTLDEKILFQNEVSFISQRYGNGRGKSNGEVIVDTEMATLSFRAERRNRACQFNPPPCHFEPAEKSRPQIRPFLRTRSSFGPFRPHKRPFLRMNDSTYALFTIAIPSTSLL